jgi:hypothetical protein
LIPEPFTPSKRRFTNHVKPFIAIDACDLHEEKHHPGEISGKDGQLRTFEN